MRTIGSVLPVALLLCAIPAGAAAAAPRSLDGESDQGYDVVLDLTRDRPAGIFFEKFKIPCEGRTPYVESKPDFEQFDFRSRHRLEDRGNYRHKTHFGRVAFRITAEQVKDGWVGELRVRTKVIATRASCSANIGFPVGGRRRAEREPRSGPY